MLPPTTRRELDACGIGFVADAAGPPVPARSSPRPSAGWPASSTGAPWPPTPAPPTARACSSPSRRRSSARAPAWRCCSSGATTPGRRSRRRRPPRASRSSTGGAAARPTTRARRPGPGHRARASCRPCSPATAGRRRRGRASAALPPAPAHRGDDRRAPTSRRARSARSSTRASSPPTALADFYLDLADDRFEAPLRHLPPAVLHQHRCRRGSGPSRSARSATTARSTPSGATRTACAAAAVLGTEEVGLGPEELFRPVLDPDDSDSGKLDAAVELLDARRARHPPRHGDARARGVGERRATSTPRCAASTATTRRSWSRGTARPASSSPTASASAPRSTATACGRCAAQVCEDGLVVVLLRGRAPSTVSGHGEVRRGRLGPGPDAVRRPDARRSSTTPRCKERLAAAAPYAELGGRRLLPAAPRASRSLRAARRPRAPARPCTAAREEDLAMVLKPMATDANEPTFSMGDDSPLPDAAPRRRARSPLPEAAVRAGHQPADRPPARAAGDEPAHAARSPRSRC